MPREKSKTELVRYAEGLEMLANAYNNIANKYQGRANRIRERAIRLDYKCTEIGFIK